LRIVDLRSWKPAAGSDDSSSFGYGYRRLSVSVLCPRITAQGSKKSAAIAKEALATGGSVYDLVLQKGSLS